MSVRKVCPILTAGSITKNSDTVKGIVTVYTGIDCMRERCEWYGQGCPRYRTQLELDLVAENERFMKELYGDKNVPEVDGSAPAGT